MRTNKFYKLESSTQRTPVAGITVVMGVKLVLTLRRIRVGGTFRGPVAQPLSLWVRHRDQERRHLPQVMLQERMVLGAGVWACLFLDAACHLCFTFIDLSFFPQNSIHIQCLQNTLYPEHSFIQIYLAYIPLLQDPVMWP